ncbi:hypothetical protein [Haliangium ochraceum]|uniref:Lipoprotein n=1 Tax=Haliangium ochraceum (strain DSM 14365 / JCM 11303 / SMP-2) TaxID=502025 RepID=D0LM13_HALO1|nr:hypothetical protein [Haliangium ochraceum]ACY15191.1 hypothetical protein Hoch_2660 [Haliangium ochraceum DSM 14365]
MKTLVLLLSFLACSVVSCGEQGIYSHTLAWVCISATCERTEPVRGLDRAWDADEQINLYSSSDPTELHVLNRISSEGAPENCELLYGLMLFGHALEPLTICTVGAERYDFEVSIPNVNPETSSSWRVELRPL